MGFEGQRWNGISNSTGIHKPNTPQGLLFGLLGIELGLEPQGQLTLTIAKGNNLKNREMIGKSCPYVIAYIRSLEKFKTKVVDNNLNPVWDHVLQLIVEDKESHFAVLEVWDQHIIGKDKRLGITMLSLIDLQPEIEKEIELKLQPSLDTLKIKDKKDRGTLTIKVKYHEFTKEEQDYAIEEEKRIIEEKKRLKAEGIIGSTMDAMGSGVGLIGIGVGLVGTGVGTGVGLVGSGLSKAGKFMGRTITGTGSSKRSGASSTPVNSVEENGGAKPR